MLPKKRKLDLTEYGLEGGRNGERERREEENLGKEEEKERRKESKTSPQVSCSSLCIVLEADTYNMLLK